VRQGRCHLRDTVPPTPVRLTRRALEGGPAAPSNIFYVLIQGHAMTSGRRDRSSLSLSALCGHARHCRTMPDTVETSQRVWDIRGQDIATTATVPRTGPPSTAPSNRPTTAAGQPTATPPPSKPLLYDRRNAPRRLNRSGIRQDGRQLRSPVRHNSTRREIVRHACKLLLPWPIKGGAVLPAAGTRDDG
jgi:hypothetical protein